MSKHKIVNNIIDGNENIHIEGDNNTVDKSVHNYNKPPCY